MQVILDPLDEQATLKLEATLKENLFYVKSKNVGFLDFKKAREKGRAIKKLELD